MAYSVAHQAQPICFNSRRILRDMAFYSRGFQVPSYSSSTKFKYHVQLIMNHMHPMKPSLILIAFQIPVWYRFRELPYVYGVLFKLGFDDYIY